MLTTLDIVGYTVTLTDDGKDVTARLGSASCRVDRDSYLDAFKWGPKRDTILAEITLDALLAAGILVCDEWGDILTEEDVIEQRRVDETADAERRAYRKSCL